MTTADTQNPALVGAGAIFIDDIVLPDGQTHMAQLGGGTVHALMGVALWGEKPGLSAYAGQGLPDGIVGRLAQYMDMRGLVHLDVPQIRAWQLFEHDGTRRELHRTPVSAPFVAGTMPDDLPDPYRAAKGYYLLQDFDGIRRWQKAVQGIILWEPNAVVMLPENREAFRAAVRECPVDVISPNLDEARVIYGALSADGLIDALHTDGARVVALRMGAAGSIISERSGARHHISAVPVETIIDQTGAGNTYCGGLLTGLLRGYELRKAAAMGAVSASFGVQTIGVLDVGVVDTGERDRRLEALLAQGIH